MKKSLVKLAALSSAAFVLAGTVAPVVLAENAPTAGQQEENKEQETDNKDSETGKDENKDSETGKNDKNPGVKIDDYNKQKEAEENTPLAKAKADLTNKINTSGLPEDQKAALVAKVDAAETLYDVLETLGAEVDAAIAANSEKKDTALEAKKEKVQKGIYESKISEEDKNSLYSRAVNAKTEENLQAVIDDAVKLGIPKDELVLPEEPKPETPETSEEPKPETPETPEKDLDTVKKEALARLDLLKALTKAEVEHFTKAILNAESANEVAAIIKEAEDVNFSVNLEAETPAKEVKPEESKEGSKKEEKKEDKKEKLPETGEVSSFAIFGGAALSVLAGLGLVASKKEEK